MSNKITSIQFKRGTKQALTALLQGSSKPFRGEPIWEIDTNRLKIGDGENDYSDLPYASSEAANLGLVMLGYYKDNCFYQDSSYINPYPYYTSKLYLDVSTNKIYYFTSGSPGKFNELVQEAQVDSNLPGLVKLYSTTGNNEDGTITQKALTTILSKKVEMSLKEDLLELKGEVGQIN